MCPTFLFLLTKRFLLHLTRQSCCSSDTTEQLKASRRVRHGKRGQIATLTPH
jgi:hypothetical protein